MSKLIKQGACVIMRTDEPGQVLCCTRRNSDILCLPGGSVDPGETPIMAAVREMKEETGLIIDPALLELVYVDMEADQFGSFQVFCYIYTKPLVMNGSRGGWVVEPGIMVMTVPQQFLTDEKLSAFSKYNKRALEIADIFYPR